MRITLCGMLAVLGCTNPTLPPLEGVVVEMHRAVLGDEPGIRVEVTNRTEASVFITGCSFFVQRRVGEGWELARSGACVYVLNEIPPGESRERTFPTVSGGLYRPGIGFQRAGEEEWQFAYGATVAW